MSDLQDDDRDYVRALIERLGDGGLLRGEEVRIRHFMLKACDMIDAPPDNAYLNLINLARRCEIGQCTEQEIVEGRARASVLMQAYRDREPRWEASFRSVRFLLTQPDAELPDAFDVLWAFVDSVERAGVDSRRLSAALEDTFRGSLGAPSRRGVPS